MHKFPHVHIVVADGASRHVLIERATNALEHVHVSREHRKTFLYFLPSGYADTVAYIREWFETD